MNASEAQLVLNHLPDLTLKRLGDTEDAGLIVTSLPWPAAPARDLSLAGRPTHCQPLGQWPGATGPAPRRLLLTADGGGDAPAVLGLADAVPSTPATIPSARMVKFRECQEEGFMWQNHSLELSLGGRTVQLALGLRRGDEVNWWEACGIEVLEDGPWCKTIKMAGAIPHTLVPVAELMEVPGYECKWLHYHNWLNGELVVRMFGNGVVEIFARHLNMKQVDEGHALEDCLPLIGIWGDGVAADAAPILGDWTGATTRVRLGGADLDLSEAANLVSADAPGSFALDDAARLLWQPYEGVQLYGGISPEEKTGDPWIVRASSKTFPRGMARTVRLSLSLSERSPRIVRYLAPAGWYGVCREFNASPWLPIANALDERLRHAADWAARTMARGCFEDGCLPRGSAPGAYWGDGKRYEPGWEGDMPHAEMLGAYRFGDATIYSTALRSAYFVTDCVVDHADKLFRMHGFPFPPLAYALPMNRPMCAISGWLETGDPYLLDTAEAVVEAANRLHLNSWPRLAVGRDSCYLRGAVALYRYTASDHFRKVAVRGCRTVANVQRPNGSFGDQGGGAGIHQWGGFITKPWMGCLATSPLLDLLELEPDRAEHADIAACIRNFGDWLMTVRWERDGVYSWSYQNDYNGKPKHYEFYRREWVDLPARWQWHHDQLARVLMWNTAATGDASFADAWFHSAETTGGETHGDHPNSATLMFQPYLQAKLWRARLTPTGVTVEPRHIGTRTPLTGEVLLPLGDSLAVGWEGDAPVLSAGVRLA